MMVVYSAKEAKPCGSASLGPWWIERIFRVPALHHIPAGLAGVGIRPLLLQLRPVTDREEFGPDLVGILFVVGVHGVLVGVGGLLDLFIVPGVLVVVGPGDHAVQEVLGVGVTVDGAVDHGHGLGPGDVLLGPEGPIGIPIHDAGVGGLVDVVRSPVAGNVGEEVLPLISRLEEASGDGGELGPGDVALRPDGSVGIAHDVGVVVLGVQLGLVTGIHRGRGRIVGIRVRVHHWRVGAVVLLVHQHEGGEAVGGEGQVVVAALNTNGRGVILHLRVCTIHLVIVYNVEVPVGVGVFRHGPVDGDILTGRDHGVAVVGVHQVQIEGLGLGVTGEGRILFTNLTDGVLLHLIVEGGIVGHAVHQQTHAVGVHGYLAVVDVELHVVTSHGGGGISVHTVAIVCDIVDGVLIHHALNGEVPGVDVYVAGDGRFAYSEHSLDLALVQSAIIDGHLVGGRGSILVHHDDVIGYDGTTFISKLQTNRGVLKVTFNGIRAQAVDIRENQSPILLLSPVCGLVTCCVQPPPPLPVPPVPVVPLSPPGRTAGGTSRGWTPMWKAPDRNLPAGVAEPGAADGVPGFRLVGDGRLHHRSKQKRYRGNLQGRHRNQSIIPYTQQRL